MAFRTSFDFTDHLSQIKKLRIDGPLFVLNVLPLGIL